MRSLFIGLLIFGLLAIGQSDKLPVFPDQYTAHGVILLPYAEIRETFAAYYDGLLNRSRIDYYGDLEISLQKSPAAEKEGNAYGNQYLIVWEGDSTGKAKRVCFKESGSEGQTVTGQNLLPNLEGFTRIGSTRCPIENIQEFTEGSLKAKVKAMNQMRLVKSNHPASCELWRKKVVVGEKSSTYSFWFKRDPKTSEPIPVTYEMQGYNSLLGSHYDHYIIHYTNFRDGLLNEDIFNINAHYGNCGAFPGPGNTKSRKLLFNPMRAYFDQNRQVHDEHFDEFKEKHGKNYETDYELEARKKVFLDNSRFIASINRRNPSYRLAVNHLADKTDEELSILRGRQVTKTENNGGQPFKPKRMYASNGGNDSLPTNWDWRLLGAVNPVKDQAICGSCWSFGTTGTLEGVYFVKTGKLIRLSEQQLIDCSWDHGNNACNGGEDFRSYEYIMQAGGLATEEDYGHYLGIDGKCHANDVKRTLKLKGFVNVTQYDVDALKQALYENGPVTIAINASPKTFSYFSHGILDDPSCRGDPSYLNHQVLLVGWGTLNNKDYWLVKNSWSTLWGNDGYILIAQKNNICGVTTSPTYPIIDV